MGRIAVFGSTILLLNALFLYRDPLSGLELLLDFELGLTLLEFELSILSCLVFLLLFPSKRVFLSLSTSLGDPINPLEEDFLKN